MGATLLRRDRTHLATPPSVQSDSLPPGERREPHRAHLRALLADDRFDRASAIQNVSRLACSTCKPACTGPSWIPCVLTRGLRCSRCRSRVYLARKIRLIALLCGSFFKHCYPTGVSGGWLICSIIADSGQERLCSSARRSGAMFRRSTDCEAPSWIGSCAMRTNSGGGSAKHML